MKSKEWIKTDWGYSGKINKSRTGSSDQMAHNGTRSWKGAKDSGAMRPTPADEAIDAIPAKTKTHKNLDSKMAPTPATYNSAQMIGAPKSGEKNLSPAVDALPKKWHKRGYDMSVPAALDGNMRRG